MFANVNMKRTHSLPSPWLACIGAIVLLASCSTTRGIPEGDQLYVGQKGTVYINDSLNAQLPVAESHFESTREEVEAALATRPNGALFGSSRLRSPLQVGLWVWNAFHASDKPFSKWIVRSFGSEPVLMSNVNPTLRAKVAESVLRSHGYTQGKVSFEEMPMKNPKKGKLAYTVQTGPLMTLYNIEYHGFPKGMDSLVIKSRGESPLQVGEPFSVASLDQERQRISNLLRNRGYYYFQPSYVSFLADTVRAPHRSDLRVILADSLPQNVTKRWSIGNISMNIRRSFMEQPTDSFVGRRFKVAWAGKRPVLRPRVVLGAMRLRPGQTYSYDRYQRSASNVNQMGLFSMVDYQFTPRQGQDTLDLSMNCVLDKPYDFYIETSFKNRTIGRYGPQLRMGLTRRNAFHGGEKLDINVHGSYEWQGKTRGTSMDSYEYGIDGSVEFPRLIAPFFGGNNPRMTEEKMRRARLAGGKMPNIIISRTTLAKASTNIIRRPGYYKMHVVGGEWTYRWKTLRAGSHEFSPLTVKYQYMNEYTDKFEDILSANPYLAVTMSDHFIPQMRYTYLYTSNRRMLSPIRWETTVSEAGNVTSLFFLARGKGWNDREKELFKTPYSQFFKIETDLTKTWRLNAWSNLVGHVGAGYIHCYGNSTEAPFSEMFYIGGANSVRALPVRGAGPGASAYWGNQQYAFLMANGEIKVQANLEWRQRLFGGLWAAVFLDAGNVWKRNGDTFGDNLKEEEAAAVDDMTFHFDTFWRQLAIGTGVGLRYDLDFLVLRLDWGVGLHMPYDTGRSGFYNIDSFKDSHTLHFAIGYPF